MNTQRTILLVVCTISAISVGPQPEARKLHGYAETLGRNDIFDRIFGGSFCKPHKYPFLAILVKFNSKAIRRSFCGGSIITERHVLTAAHCVKYNLHRFPLGVAVGAHNLSEMTRHQVKMVKTIKIHENWDGERYDIAVLVLAETLRFNSIVQPVCLPPSGFDVTGRTVKIMGWGLQGDDEDSTWTPKVIEMDVISQSACARRFEKEKYIPQNDDLCTLHRGRSTCHGDSGGPVVYGEQNHYTLVGVISGGFDCSGELPTVQTKVETYLPWIDEKIKATYPRAEYCISTGR